MAKKLVTAIQKDEVIQLSVYPLQQAFDQNLQLVGTFATCEQFWSLYSHLIRPGDLQSHSDFHIFKRGIKPLWEVCCHQPSYLRFALFDYEELNLSTIFFLSEYALQVYDCWLGLVGAKMLLKTLMTIARPKATVTSLIENNSGRGKSVWRQVDSPPSQGFGFAVLGKSRSGDAWGTVHGRRRDLRRCGVGQISGDQSLPNLDFLIPSDR